LARSAGEPESKAWMKAHQLRLPGKGKIEKPVIALHSTVSSHPEAIGKLRTEAALSPISPPAPVCLGCDRSRV